MNKVSTQWFVVVAATVTASWFAHQKGVFVTLFENDVSRLSWLIMALLVIGTVVMGFTARIYDKDGGNYNTDNTVKRRLKLGRFLATRCWDVGLAGTIAGFMILFHQQGFTEEVIKLGMSTALFTTLAGMIANMILKTQAFIIAYPFED